MRLRRHYCIYFIYLCISYGCIAKRVVVDEVLAIVPHMGGDRIILASDMLMHYGTGEQKTFRDIVLEELMVVHSRDLGISIPDPAIDSMIAMIQKRSGINREQLTEMFESQGMTWQEGREMLRNRRMIEEMLSIIIRPPEPTKEEIRRYYGEHAPQLPAEYTVRLGFIPADVMSSDEVYAMVKSGVPAAVIQWDRDQSYRDNQLTAQQQFIRSMELGAMYIMDENADGYDLVQLVSKKDAAPIPFDEAQIVAMMHESIYKDLLEKFQKELLARVKIRYCKPGIEGLLE